MLNGHYGCLLGCIRFCLFLLIEIPPKRLCSYPPSKDPKRPILTISDGKGVSIHSQISHLQKGIATGADPRTCMLANQNDGHRLPSPVAMAEKHIKGPVL